MSNLLDYLAFPGQRRQAQPPRPEPRHACPIGVRYGLATLAAAAITLLTASSASAIDYRWCARYGGLGAATNCGFSTFRQCQATISGVGGYCYQNPYYVPQKATRRSHRRTSE
jgi:hypothetical protein